MWPLWLASQGYRAAASAHRTSYEWGLLRRRQLPCPVVSIGNLTVGGTGKTPLTEWTAQWLHRQGWRVVVLSRGYGGSPGERPKVASTGEGPLTDWRAVGDEAYLLANRLNGVPVVVGRNRYTSGAFACAKFGAQVLVLDDGFQHHALHRDSDIVLIDATRPFGHGALLPRGTLREPLHALRRAQVIVLTRVETAGDSVSALSRRIRRYARQQRSTIWPSVRAVCTGTTPVVRWTCPGSNSGELSHSPASETRKRSPPPWRDVQHGWRRLWRFRITIPTPRPTGRSFAMRPAAKGRKPWSPLRKTPSASNRRGWLLYRFVPCVSVSSLPRTIRLSRAIWTC